MRLQWNQSFRPAQYSMPGSCLFEARGKLCRSTTTPEEFQTIISNTWPILHRDLVVVSSHKVADIESSYVCLYMNTVAEDEPVLHALDFYRQQPFLRFGTWQCVYCLITHSNPMWKPIQYGGPGSTFWI